MLRGIQMLNKKTQNIKDYLQGYKLILKSIKINIWSF
ncbi:MAG: hypothetical protein ACJA2M_000380 [Polaribacter sp.]|jgi:hypothetical protein